MCLNDSKHAKYDYQRRKMHLKLLLVDETLISNKKLYLLRTYTTLQKI